MSSFANALKAEISRVARKEIKGEVATLRKTSAMYRKRIAELNRQNQQLHKRLASLEGKERKRPAAEEEEEAATTKVRFSPNMIARHRAKLGVSAADYARLVGVSAMTIYKWEQGKSRPRAQQLADWAAVRHLGKRAAIKQLETESESE